MPATNTPAAVITVPVLGAPSCGGHTLLTANLSDFAHESDSSLADDYERNLAACIRARRDGFVLCMRPAADRPAVIDMGQHFAADALSGAEALRFLIVDPYSVDGDDLRMPAPTRIQSVSPAVVQVIASRMLDPMPPLMGYFAHTGEAFAEIAAAAEIAATQSDKRIVIDSITSVYEQELAQAYEAGRQWGKFKPWSTPLRARGWRWPR